MSKFYLTLIFVISLERKVHGSMLISNPEGETCKSVEFAPGVDILKNPFDASNFLSNGLNLRNECYCQVISSIILKNI